VLDFLYVAVSWVLLRWHQFFTFVGLKQDSGLNWALSIIFLVITARLLLFRLFVKQVKYQRKMTAVQPKLQEIRNKYKNDRAAMQREMMKLQQEEGFNPLAGCLPLLLQWPIFIGLFHVLRHLANSVNAATKYTGGQALTAGESRSLTLYTFSASQTASAARARLFGSPLAGALRDSTDMLHSLGGNVTSTRIVILVLVVFSAGATFSTQLLVRAAQTTIPEGQAAMMQRLMLWVIPVMTLGSGLFFPLGVLIYWFASNTWTMLQQLYINKFHPPAEAPVVEVGSVGRTLAPRPGQKPVRNTARRPAGPASGAEAASEGSEPSHDGTDGAAKAAAEAEAAGERPSEGGSRRGRSGSGGSAAGGGRGGSTGGASGDGGADGGGSGGGAGSGKAAAPKPGQRPNRPASGNRPGQRRPNQAKKRR